MTHAILYRVLQTAFRELGIRHFQPEEFVPLRRKVPPFPLWGHIIPTAIVLDSLRTQFGPITITSGYRDPDYNISVGGGVSSQHVQFTAADIVARDHSADAVFEWLDASSWSPRLALGRYDTFTHLDTRNWVTRAAWPARWDNRT